MPISFLPFLFQLNMQRPSDCTLSEACVSKLKLLPDNETDLSFDVVSNGAPLSNFTGVSFNYTFQFLPMGIVNNEYCALMYHHKVHENYLSVFSLMTISYRPDIPTLWVVFFLGILLV